MRKVITYQQIIRKTVKKTVEIDLKPCPCCGGEADFKYTKSFRQRHWDDKGSASVQCTHCKISTPFKSSEDHQLVVAEIWNQREPV